MKKKLFIIIIFFIFLISSCKKKENIIDKQTESFNPINSYSLLLDKSVYTKGGYTDGNYGNSNHMEYYRTYATRNSYTKLLKKNQNDINDSAVYNMPYFSKIYSVIITYQTDSFLNFSYSNDKSYDNNVILPKTNGFETYSIKFNPSNFIRFSSSEDVVIEKIVIYYDSKEKPSYDKVSYDGFRIKLNYNEFDNLKDGLVRTIPTKISFDGSNYNVLETKDFKYYSRNYLSDNFNINNKADKLALTDPLDVASYYMLFHDFPLNYGYTSDLLDLDDYFSESLLRKVQSFSRTDGYATSVPYKKDCNVEYLELDFAKNEKYTTSQRGTGRIVVFINGFEGKTYSDEPVCLYTDDHYATFSEFTNAYSFNKAFDAEMNYTGNKHTLVNLYNLK